MKTKKDIITWIIIFIIIGLFLWQLPNFYKSTVTKTGKNNKKEEKIIVEIPEKYMCSLIDSTTEENGYKTVQDLAFSFNEDGSLKETNGIIEYMFINKDLYNTEKAKTDGKIQTLGFEGIESSVELNDGASSKKVTFKINHESYKKVEQDDLTLNLINDLPTNYNELKKYMSNHLYSCRKK